MTARLVLDAVIGVVLILGFFGLCCVIDLILAAARRK